MTSLLPFPEASKALKSLRKQADPKRARERVNTAQQRHNARALQKACIHLSGSSTGGNHEAIMIWLYGLAAEIHVANRRAHRLVVQLEQAGGL